MIDNIKNEIPFLRYIYIPNVDGKKESVIVPEAQMIAFRAITESNDNGMIYFKPEEINLQKGTKVRVHGGLFDGLEGTFMKVKGARDKRIVVEIPNVISVASCSLQCDIIEVLP